MRVRVLSVQKKDITTKAGQSLQLRIVNGCTEDGQVFTFNLPKSHPEVPVGFADVKLEPWINYDTELAARVSLVPVAPEAKPRQAA